MNRIIFWTLILSTSVISLHAGRSTVQLEGAGYSIAIKRIQCLNSTNRVLVDVCKLKLMRGKMGTFWIGFTVLQRESNLLFRLRVDRKTSANFYVPTVIDVTFNLCDLTRSNQTVQAIYKVLDLFSREAVKIMSPFLHPCPYYGRHESLNVTIDKLTMPNFIPTGEVILYGTVMDGKKTKLFELAAYLYVKTPSLMQIN